MNFKSLVNKVSNKFDQISSAVPEIARDSIKIEAEFMWLQLGVMSPEGIEIATQRGINCIVDLCIKIEHARRTGNSN